MPPKRSTKPAAAVDDTAMLPSPTTSVGPEWDREIPRLDDDTLAIIRAGPSSLSNTPVAFNNPKAYCYRNALMTVLMYTNPFLGWLQNYHMAIEFPKHPYEHHILQALDHVREEYHGTKNRNTRADKALNQLWQMFRGKKTSIATFEGAVPAPSKANHEDTRQWLEHLLTEALAQMTEFEEGKMEEDLTPQQVFEAMFTSTLTTRIRCPSTRDGSCPNQKQRRETLDDGFVWSIPLPASKDRLTLERCIENELQNSSTAYCTDCQKSGRDLLHPDREDKQWSRLRSCPEVLFMCLLRFDNDGNKLSQHVDIPERLDVSNYLERHTYGEGSHVEYELQAVINHSGSLAAGHYVAHVKVGESWWRVDDLGGSAKEEVKPSSIEMINNDGASRSRKTTRGQFTPYLFAWVKTRDEKVDPEPVKTGQEDDEEKDEPAGNDEGTIKPDGEGTGGQGPSGPDEPPSSPSSNDFHDNEWASPDTANITVTLTVGNNMETIILKGKTKKGLGTFEKNPPVFGTIRIVDEKGTGSSSRITNTKGSAMRTKVEAAAKKEKAEAAAKKRKAEDAAKKKKSEDASKKKKAEDAAKKKKAANGLTSKSSEKSSKRKDAGDDTYVEESEERAKKKAKRAGKPKAEAEPEDDTLPVTPKAPGRRRKLMQGHKPTPPEEA